MHLLDTDAVFDYIGSISDLRGALHQTQESQNTRHLLRRWLKQDATLYLWLSGRVLTQHRQSMLQKLHLSVTLAPWGLEHSSAGL